MYAYDFEWSVLNTLRSVHEYIDRFILCEKFGDRIARTVSDFRGFIGSTSACTNSHTSQCSRKRKQRISARQIIHR